MPRNLVEAAVEQGRDGWLDTLPGLVADLAGRWSLTVGAPFQPGGQTAWVAPAERDGAGPLVLKIGWRHDEAAHEADGLRFWAGEGAVLLHDALDLEEASVLLLERCRPGEPLSGRPPEEQDAVLTGLLPRLWRRPPDDAPFRALRDMCDAWADGFEAKAAAGRSRLDPGLARVGIELFRSLPASADRHVVLATDLHAGNVLAAEREPWLVIDPKPYVGDPAYDILQHLLNCPDRLHADPRGLATRMADRLGLDPDRVRLWLFARCVQESPEWPGLDDVARRLAPA